MNDYMIIFFCILLMTSITTASFSYDNTTGVPVHDIVKKGQPSGPCPPNQPCNNFNEGKIRLDQNLNNVFWICKSGQWIPKVFKTGIGIIASLCAESCNNIRVSLTPHCGNTLSSGLYWLCCNKDNPMQVYCDMSTDSGGWTLVWKQSYLETLPLSKNMYYFSDYYKNCTNYSSGWCNIPNKKCFRPTEQMIVAYHYGDVVYAYKGVFNYNIDHDWTGGVLVDSKIIIDKCVNTNSKNIQPAPSSKRDNLLGLAFDKASPCDYFADCDTIGGTFDSPYDCRWHDCSRPTRYKTQQTVAIYVR